LIGRYKQTILVLRSFETKKRLPEDDIVDIGTASVAVYDMGRIGTGAYDNLRQRYGRQVIGIDSDEKKVSYHVKKGQKVIHGDAS